MNFSKGSGTVIGGLTGLIIGFLTDNVLSFLFLGLMFGIIGDMAYPRKDK